MACEHVGGSTTGCAQGGSLSNKAFVKGACSRPSCYFAAVINVAYTRFKVDKGIIDVLVHPRKKGRRGGGGKQLPESQSSRCRFGVWFTLTMPGSSRYHPSSRGETIRVIVAVCVAFGLTVSEVKTEIYHNRS